MSTCQTAANEFLRHYWHSIYPPPSQASLPLTETLKNQRAAKAAKMAGYLASTHEKVEAIVKAAPYEKVDPRRVELVRTEALMGDRPCSCSPLRQCGRFSMQSTKRWLSNVTGLLEGGRRTPKHQDEGKVRAGVIVVTTAMSVRCDIRLCHAMYNNQHREQSHQIMRVVSSLGEVVEQV